MKKYLMMGLAALAFASCSNKDVFDQELVDQMKQNEVVEKYNKAFIRVFGQPAANQDWGFGLTNTAARTRAISVDHQFASTPDDSDYATEKDPNAVLIKGYETGTNFYIDESINGNGQTIQPNVPWDASVKDVVLYVVGNVKPTDIYTPGNTTIYLLPGSKLTIPSKRASFGQNYTHIYIAKDAELIIEGGTAEFGTGVKVYNRGKITVDNITISNNGLVYNEGTIDIPGKIKVSNNNSELVNDGTLKAANLGTEGSGHVQNNGTAVISNETLINSNNNTWVNNGDYTTGYFTYQAGSCDVVNNCLLSVKEDFYINLGDTADKGFRLDGAAGVVTKNFNGAGPFFIYMGGNSVFKVTGTATMNATKANYGFYGNGTEYAVLDAAKIEKGAENQGYEITYGGNLAVVTESHFANGYSGTYPYIDIKDNAVIYAPGFTEGAPEITIEATACNPGFSGGTNDDEEKGEENEEGNDPTDDTDWEFIVRIFAEDLSATDGSDFDFNDVVFDVYNSKKQGENKAKIVLLAAGGTIPLTVEGVEVHAAFAEANPELGISVGTMINTNRGTVKADKYPEIILNRNIANAAAAKAIELKTEKQIGELTEWIEMTAETGQPAAKFGVNDQSVEWCDERQGITEKYPDFSTWVGKPEHKWW